jgi:putative endonuclease
MKQKFRYYVYILTNAYNTVFYIGVTNNITKRFFEHKTGLIKGFTKKYRVKKLVYLEEYNNINEAIKREKQLKNWHREWKINLIKKVNPEPNDLAVFG